MVSFKIFNIGIPSISSIHSGIKLEINSKENWKIHKYMESKQYLLELQWVKKSEKLEPILRQMKIKMGCNSITKRKLIAVNNHIKIEEKISNQQPKFISQETRKKKITRPKISWGKN